MRSTVHFILFFLLGLATGLALPRRQPEAPFTVLGHVKNTVSCYLSNIAPQQSTAYRSRVSVRLTSPGLSYHPVILPSRRRLLHRPEMRSLRRRGVVRPRWLGQEELIQQELEHRQRLYIQGTWLQLCSGLVTSGCRSTSCVWHNL